MPRRTPVKELQKEETVVSSPLRRSTRLSTSSPVPTKVIARRNSASEAAPLASTPKATRGRRSSFNQENEALTDTKKPASVVRARRSIVTKISEDPIEEPIQEEPAPKAKTRGSSVSKDEPSEIKNTRRRSVNDDSKPEEQQTKKLAKGRSGSASRKTASDVTTAIKKQNTANTPVKKLAASEDHESLEDENVKGFPTYTRKLNTKVVKEDMDLSIINEASISEEELTPQNKNKSFEDKNEGKSVELPVIQVVEEITSDEKVIEVPEPKLVNIKNTLEIVQEKAQVPQNNTVDNSDNKSEDSFIIELSYGDNAEKEERTFNISDKENVSPEKPQDECEPMEVDVSVLESSPFEKSAQEIEKAAVSLQKSDIEKTLKMVEKVNDEITEFLSEDIVTLKEKKSNISSNNETVVTTSLMHLQNKLQPFVVLQRENFEKNAEESDDAESLEIIENIEKTNKIKNSEERSEQTINNIEIVKTIETEGFPKLADVSPKKTTKVLNVSFHEKTSLVDEDSHVTEKHVDVCEENLKNQSKEIEQDAELPKNMGRSPEILEHDLRERSEQQPAINEQQMSVSQNRKDVVASSNKEIVESAVNSGNAEALVEKKTDSNINNLSNSKTDELNKVELNQNSEDNVLDKLVIEKPTNSELQDQLKETGTLDEEETFTNNSIKEVSSQKNIDEPEVTIDETIVIEEKSVKSCKENLSSSISAVDSSVLLSDDSSFETEEDVEIQNINSDKDVYVKEIITLSTDNTNHTKTADLCKSSAKMLKSHISVSDDELFTTSKEKSANSKTSSVFDRSIDSPYSLALYQREVKPETIINDSSLSEEVFEVRDDEEEDREKDLDKSKNSNEINKNDNEITKSRDETQNESINEEIDTSLLSNSFKKRSDRTSITLQETIKAGEDEKHLSGRIYKVVDLFCAGIKNTSDVSINVSLEYNGQDSEDEIKTDVIEIALTAEEIKNSEPQKGSKRRKICHTLEPELKSPKTDNFTGEGNQSVDKSVTTSNVIIEDKNRSAKKKKRKSKNNLMNSDAIAVKSSPKVSFSTDLEDDEGLDNLNKSQLSISCDNRKQCSPSKKTLPLTPYKSSKQNKESDEENSFYEEMNEEEVEENSDAQNVSSESDNSEVLDLLYKSFDESDPNDTTWKFDEQESSEEYEQDIIEEGDDESEIIKNLSSVELPLSPRKAKSKSFTSSTNTLSDERNDNISVDESEKENRKRTASQADKEAISKKCCANKKRKLFRLSRYNVEQALETSDSDENIDKNKDKLKSRKNVSPQKSKTKKTAKSKFITKNIGKILPESSETKNNRKRSRGQVKDDSQLQTKRNKHFRKDAKEEVNYNVIKPSGRNLKHVKPLKIKPSTKANSDWEVSSLF